MTERPANGRVAIEDPDGRVVADYRPLPMPGSAVALDLRVRDATTERAAEVVVAVLPGWAVSTDPVTSAALVAAGAVAGRQSHNYRWEFGPTASTPTRADWVRPPPTRGPVVRPAAEVGPKALYAACAAAYPPGHIDHAEASPESLDPLFDGTVVGPLLPCSSVVLDGARAVAAALVNDHDPRGPWLTQVFRDPAPRYAGLGTFLIRRALALAERDGAKALGLTVTAGNPAALRYAALGFHRTETFVSLRLPGAEARADAGPSGAR
ncbi:GNAT family N-acetyltransferase [Embleya sp. AB8]|uniref:GNAT family N-acetyltransferase n=1 Tax=Embleya sp. AB8 TaxID=3156304 RepID=UPI003C7381D3